MARDVKPTGKKDRRPRMEFDSEYKFESIYVSKRHYDGILKKVFIRSIRPIGGAGGQIVIEYQSKRGKSHGVLVLNDIGPMPKQEE